jgi:uncharacterized protein YdeI (BOF family)
MRWTLILLVAALTLGCSSKDDPESSAPPTVEVTDISYLKEMNGTVPAHEGETIYIEGVATMGTGVMVSGRYMKFHIQDDTGGAYVFADTQAQAAVATQQTDGSSFLDVEIYEGDLVRIQGEIGSHEGMIEFYPLSGEDILVQAAGQSRPAPHVFSSVDEIYDDPEPYQYVGDLVRVNGVEIQGDPSAAWPAHGQNTSGGREVQLKTAGDTNTLYLAIYAGSGIPGSNYPDGAFDIVGVLHRGETSYTIYPRALYDINPADGALLTGYGLDLYEYDRDEEDRKRYIGTVSVDDLAQCSYDRDTGEDPGPEPVVTLASFITPEIVTDPKNWNYKIFARDDRTHFETLEFNEMKSGMVYEDEYEEQDVLKSYFYEGMGLSDIYFLNDLAGIILFPLGEGPQTGEATYGEGITLIINETSYPVNFEDLPNPELTERPLADFVPDDIMSVYDMDLSFSQDQIRILYDYRLIPYGGVGECFPVTWDEIDPETDPPMVSLSNQAPFATVTGLAGCGQIDDLFTIEMVRKVIIDDGVGEEVFYWEDLATVTVGDEEVIFFETLLDTAGLSEAEKVENDYLLYASDDFGTYFPYGHHHLEDMYFRPLANRTFVTDDNPDMPGYGGRYSVKALLRVELRPIPQELPSLFVDDGLATGWLSDPESGATCNGCHFKRGEVEIPVNCAACHTM